MIYIIELWHELQVFFSFFSVSLKIIFCFSRFMLLLSRDSFYFIRFPAKKERPLIRSVSCLFFAR